ncbi:MAG: hypothetical protein WKF95_08995 [Rubrobacter sp.]
MPEDGDGSRGAWVDDARADIAPGAVFPDYDLTPSFEELRRYLREVTRKVGPDWDLLGRERVK